VTYNNRTESKHKSLKYHKMTQNVVFKKCECSYYGHEGLAMPVIVHILPREGFIIPILNPE
jgi:hypothetical protein